MPHTPGPWTAVRYEYGWHIGPQPDAACEIGDNTDGSNYDAHEANARLIAAAPDLLAALEALLADVVGRENESCWCLPDAPDSRGLVCEACVAREVIRKAKG